MKKKIIYLVCIVIVLLICIIAYFKPISLSNTASENSQISMILNEYAIRNGEPYIDSIKYQDISTEQKSAILALFEKYTYQRTFGTPFSNGSISELGNKMLSIYVFDNKSSTERIFVTSSGKIVVNDKNYSMKNADQFIEQIMNIMKQEN